MSAPIQTSEVLNFQQIGIDPKFATLDNTSISGDRYLCVREISETEGSVDIVDLQQNNNVSRHSNNHAESAAMQLINLLQTLL